MFQVQRFNTSCRLGKLYERQAFVHVQGCIQTKSSHLTGPSRRDTSTFGAPEPVSQTWKPVVYPIRSTGRWIRLLLLDLLDVYSR